MDTMVVIDGNSLVNRAFFALPPMNSDGIPTQAIFGFAKMILSLIEKYSPTHMVVAFDLPMPTFRHLKYAEYKGTRKGMPDDLRIQLPLLKNMLQDMGIKIIEKEGFEADDILGTLSVSFDGTHTYIVTGDGDALQLISPNTTVLITKKGISELAEMNPTTIVEQKGLTPSQIIDYKALRGDASDNIPGIRGIGEKTALELLKTYQTLDGIYQNIEGIVGKNKIKLEEQKDMAYLSYELATIDKSVPLHIDKNDCLFKYPFQNKLRSIFTKLGFKSFLNNPKMFVDSEINDNQNVQSLIAIKEYDIEMIVTKDQLVKLVQKYSTDIAQDNLSVGIHYADSINLSDGVTEYTIKIQKDLLSDGMQLNVVLDALKPIFEDPNIKKIGYDIKSTMREIAKYSIEINNFFDVKLAEYILDFRWSQKDLVDYVEYLNCHKNCFASCFYHRMPAQIELLKSNNQAELYFDIELPLIKILFDMETYGMSIDISFLQNLGLNYTQQLNTLSQNIQEIAGQNFNVASPKQLAKILFEDIKLPYPDKKSKTKSTAVDILQAVKPNDHTGIIDKILRYREIAKLNGTYVEGLIKSAKNGIVHSDFKQMHTITGRLSSIEPNLQNIPTRTAEGRQIRQAFLARPGRSLVSADYSQIELRVMAHLSEDESMIAAFVSNEDIHTATASEVFDTPKNKVTSEQRRAAKAVNFGIIYGISDFGLSQDLGIFPNQAREYIKKYFQKYPKIKAYMDKSIETAKENGKISTIFNRIRVIDELKSQQRQIRNFGERVAMNMPMQGSASDIVKIAMNKVYSAIQNTTAKLILQVHDELILECDDQDTNKISQLLKECMENAVELKVPLVVEVEVGKKWE